MRAVRDARGDPLDFIGLLIQYLQAGTLARRVFVEMAGTHPAAALVTKTVAGGGAIPQAIMQFGGEGQNSVSWRIIAAVWHISGYTGAPLSGAVERLREVLMELQRGDRRRDVLLAGPKMAVRLIMILPVFSVLLGELMGFNSVRVYFSVFGLFLLLIGGFLYWAGLRWIRRMIAEVEQKTVSGGMEYELVSLALQGGAPVSRACKMAIDAINDFRLTPISFLGFCVDGGVSRIARQSKTGGAQLVHSLRMAAASARVSDFSKLEQQAEKMGVRVLVPIAVCVLPAFIVTGVIPIAISMLGILLV